jgi:hypothetical protein
MTQIEMSLLQSDSRAIAARGSSGGGSNCYLVSGSSDSGSGDEKADEELQGVNRVEMTASRVKTRTVKN